LRRVLQCTRGGLCLCSIALVADRVGLGWKSRDSWPKSVSSTPLVKLRTPNACHEENYCIKSLGSSTGEPDGESNRLIVLATSHDSARSRSIRLRDVCHNFGDTANLVIFDRERASLRCGDFYCNTLHGLQYAEGITRHLVKDETGAYCEIHLTLAVLLELRQLDTHHIGGCVWWDPLILCDQLLGESSSSDGHMRFPRLTLCCETGDKETQETVDV
jgi:hypothetical protein